MTIMDAYLSQRNSTNFHFVTLFTGSAWCERYNRIYKPFVHNDDLSIDTTNLASQVVI